MFLFLQKVRPHLRTAAVIIGVILLTWLRMAYVDMRGPVCRASGDYPTGYKFIASLPENENHHKNNTWRTQCPGVHVQVPTLDEEPQIFQKVDNHTALVYSAYFESRDGAGGPAIRVMGAGLQRMFVKVPDLYCQLWYSSDVTPVTVGPARYQSIYDSTLHPEMHCSHFILCDLPKDRDDIPWAVSVTSQPCSEPENTLLILNRKPVVKKKQHAVCLCALYGWKNWSMLAEMFELHQMVGMDSIAIYNLTTDSNSSRVLQMYAQEGQLSVMQWHLPNDGKLVFSYFLQRGYLNDCLYRMGHTHHYVSVMDIDELHVPRAEATLPELMKKIAQPKTAVYMFQHYYFRRNTSEESPYLITQSSFWTTSEPLPPGKIRCKSMYLADHVISVDIHFEHKLLDKAGTYMVKPEEGALHHYRNTPMSGQKIEDKLFIEDRTVEIYKAKLTERIKDVVQHIENTPNS